MYKDTDSRDSKPRAKTPKVRFNLKAHSKSDKEVLIIAVMNYRVYDANGKGKNKRIVYTTGKSINPKYWNIETQEAKESVNYPKSKEVNIALQTIKNEFLAVRQSYKNTKEIESDSFKTELDYRLGRKERPKKKIEGGKTFLEYLEFEIEKNKTRVDGATGGQTWQKYQSLKQRLTKFAKDSGFVIDYANFDNSFKDDFVLWLEKQELSQNTISKDIETIKTMLKRSRKFHSNNIYTDPDFQVKRIKTTEHYPTLDELRHLYNFKFENESYQKVIDLYLISAFGGGLRISDVLRLNESNEEEHDGTPILRVYTYKGRNVKSDNEVVIPITPQLRQLLNKYNWELPKFSEQYINDTLKDAFEVAKMNRTKIIKSGVLSKKAEKKALWEVVHFHTSRYAYIDYMMNDLDVSAEELRKITGQSLKVLLGYERGDKNKNASKVAAKINTKLQGLYIANKKVV